jgi:hypothetical protein
MPRLGLLVCSRALCGPQTSDSVRNGKAQSKERRQREVLNSDMNRSNLKKKKKLSSYDDISVLMVDETSDLAAPLFEPVSSH